MTIRKLAAATLFLVLATVCGSAPQAAELDLLSVTTQGSWQEREQTTTNEKGEKTVLSIRVSLVGEEVRDGEPCVWIESELQMTRVDRKGKSKQEKPIVSKALVKRSALSVDPTNALRNPFDQAVEIITQVGDQDPMRFSGKMLGKAGDILGVQVSYAFQEQGTESVTVPAGTFQTLHLKGSGSASTKIVIKRIEVQSQGDFWYSAQVPFGLVKGQGTDVVNGKSQSWTTELKSYGTSGAATKITKPPQDMPELKLPF
jgi:hypothetical protein